VNCWSRFCFSLALAGLIVSLPAQARDIRFDDIGGTGVRSVASDRYAADGLRLETSGAGLFVFGPSTFAAS
jgi:hypothetical protein